MMPLMLPLARTDRSDSASSRPPLPSRSPARNRARLRRIVAATAGLLLTACAAGREAAQTGRAGLLILHGDGSAQTTCVSFSEPSITGYELLRRSGFSLSIDAGNPMGVLVCSLDGEGCIFPDQDCLCACQEAGECTYWAYFIHPRGSEWTYSPVGPSGQEVSDGDLNAWVWLAGTGPSGPATLPLPDLDFEGICPQTEWTDGLSVTPESR